MVELPYNIIFQKIPIGLMVVDINHRIHDWNIWLESKTKISKEDAIDKTLEQLYPDFKNARFEWALEQVIKNKSPQIMSHTLNRYLIPISTNYSDKYHLQYMPQQIYIAPVQQDDAVFAMVSILDVTENIIRSNTLNELAHQLEADSHHDQLTNAYNRRFLWIWLQEQIKISKRHGINIACLLLDLDHFKNINDQYGHQIGDEVLKQFVSIIKNSLRESDILVRYGGEEFVVLLTDIDDKVAANTAERIRKKVEKNAFSQLPAGDVTCSIGIEMIKTKTEFDPEALLKNADKALYCAKNNGRNQVHLYG